jgi:hypothetical protein
MKMTNNQNLPDAIVKAIEEGDSNYTGSHGKHSDISVTRLIDSPQVAVLTKKHWEDIEEDASDRIWSLMGRLMHQLLENAGSSELKEKRLYADYNGWTVSGQFDALDVSSGTLRDYKFCSVWEYIYGMKESRVKQLNCLANLCRKNGITVNRLEVVMIFRDWKISDSKYKESYPREQVAVVLVPMTDDKFTEDYICTQVDAHRQAREGNIIACTEEDRWYSAGKVALKKDGRKTAMKLFDTEEELFLYTEKEGYTMAGVFKKGYSLEHRRGVNRRCEDYCSVSEYCDQWKNIQATTEVNDYE